MKRGQSDLAVAAVAGATAAVGVVKVAKVVVGGTIEAAANQLANIALAAPSSRSFTWERTFGAPLACGGHRFVLLRSRSQEQTENRIIPEISETVGCNAVFLSR